MFEEKEFEELLHVESKIEAKKHSVDLKLDDFELLAIAEVGVQTDDVHMTDNDQINELIKKLSNNELLHASDPELLKKYSDCH